MSKSPSIANTEGQDSQLRTVMSETCTVRTKVEKESEVSSTETKLGDEEGKEEEGDKT